MTVPGWETQILDSLAGSNKLYGVPPAILASIDQAESSGSGGAINSEGYGGFFGLGVGSAYPQGPGGASAAPVTAALLQDASPAGFAAQAQLAAGEFASLLASHGGNPYAAESAYQGGSTEGTSIFAANGIPSSIAAGSLSSNSTPGAQTTSVTGTLGQAALGAIPAVGPALSIAGALSGSWSKDALSIGLTIVFTLSGLGLIVLGLSRLFPGVSTAISLPIKP